MSNHTNLLGKKRIHIHNDNENNNDNYSSNIINIHSNENNKLKEEYISKHKILTDIKHSILHTLLINIKICELCSRKFKSQDLLLNHIQNSIFHRSNLEKNYS